MSSQGSDNNSKGSNSSSSSGSSSSGSDSDGGKGASSSSSQGTGGEGSSSGNRGSDNRGSDNSSSGADSGASQGADTSSASDTSSQTSAPSAQQAAQVTSAADAQSAETYGSFVQNVLNAAPVARTTDDDAGQVQAQMNKFDAGYAAEQALKEGRYGDYGLEKAKEGLYGLQVGYENLKQAPLDTIADISRNPMARVGAVLLGGLPGLALNTAIGITDSVADYAQGEKTAGDASLQGLSDVVNSFAPQGVKQMYNVVTNPREGIKQTVGNVVQTGNPIADMAFGKVLGNFTDAVVDSQTNPTQVMGTQLAQARQKADQSFSTRVQSSGQGMPVVMNNDAMTLHWKMLAQEEMNKPKYNSSLMFLMNS